MLYYLPIFHTMQNNVEIVFWFHFKNALFEAASSIYKIKSTT